MFFFKLYEIILIMAIFKTISLTFFGGKHRIGDIKAPFRGL